MAHLWLHRQTINVWHFIGINPDTSMNEIYTGPLCDECKAPMAYDDGICDDCRTRQLEFEQDEAWPVYIASLRYGQKQIEVVSSALDSGWQYVGGDVRREKGAKGSTVAFANQLQLTKGNACIVFAQDHGAPFITIYKGNPAFHDWQAMLTSMTPLNIILTAANAAV